MPFLKFIKKYSEILCLGGFLLYWLWDAKLSASFSSFDAKDWMSMANTLATLVLSLVALYGINSWRNEYKNKRRLEIAIDFAEKGYQAMLSIRRVTSPFISYPRPPKKDAENPRLEAAQLTSETRLALLDQEVESLNTYASKRFLYKFWLGDTAEDICAQFVNIGISIQDACHQHVELARLLPIDEDEFEMSPRYKELEKQFDNNFREFTRTSTSPLSLRLDKIQKRIDTILKENSF